jgi:hypothetical protein
VQEGIFMVSATAPVSFSMRLRSKDPVRMVAAIRPGNL